MEMNTSSTCVSDVEVDTIENLIASIPDGISVSVVRDTELGRSLDRCDQISLILAAINNNDLIDDELTKVETLLRRRLGECRDKIQEMEKKYKRRENSRSRKSFKYTRCGIPYFKDKNCWGPPDNFETQSIKKKGYHNFYAINYINPWTLNDKRDFVFVMRNFSINIHRHTLTKQIEICMKQGYCTSTLQKELNNLSLLPLSKLALPINEDYEWNDVAETLEYKHTATEYANLWKVELHPSINNKKWEFAEKTRLQELVLKHMEQDWTKIAQELGTGRSEYQCFICYTNYLNDQTVSRQWTEIEENILHRFIEIYCDSDVIPYSKIAQCMPNKTEAEIYAKWKSSQIIKGRFLPEEDEVLLSCVNKFGKNWAIISKYIKRNCRQIMRRYTVLKKTRLCKWTVEEDKRLMRLTEGKQQIDYGHLLQYFPGKTRVAIRGRYNTLSNWAKYKSNEDLKFAPRRDNLQGNPAGSSTAAPLVTALEKLNEKLKIQVQEEPDNDEFSDNDLTIMKFLFEEDFKNKTEYDLGGKINLPSETKNLQGYQLLLRAELDRSEIQKSCYAEEYSDPLNLVLTKEVRSYSRKSSTQTPGSLEVSMPDVWGNKIKGSPKVVFPPNINTLVGCKILLSTFYNCRTKCNKSVKNMCLSNIFVNDQWQQLVTRFRLLFYWTIRLGTACRVAVPAGIVQPNEDEESDE